MTFSAPLPAARTATLVSLSPNVTVPATRTLAAGASTFDFPITVAANAPDEDAWVLATVDGVTQRIYVPVIERDRIALSGFTVTALPGGAYMSWNNPPITLCRNSGPQLLIERTQITGSRPGRKQTFDLTDDRTPFEGLQTSFADSGLEAGARYAYQPILRISGYTSNLYTGPVVEIEATGTPAITATPSWTGTTVSGEVTLSGTNPGDSAQYTVYVDGVSRGTGATSNFGGGATTNFSVGLDTTKIENGSANIVLARFDESGATHLSAPIRVTVDNAVSETYADRVIELGWTPFAEVRATLPSTATSWQLDIRDFETNALIRTMTGPGQSVRALWDGKKNDGTYTADGDHVATLSYSGSSGGGTSGIYRIAFVSSPPEFLSLTMIDENGGNMREISESYGKSVTYAMRGISSTSRIATLCLPYLNGGKVTKELRNRIARWLKFSVSYLYVQGHGNRARPNGEHTAYWGDLQLMNFGTAPYREGSEAINCYNISNGRQYKFLWMDNCNSGGWKKDGPWLGMTDTPNTLWASAFNMDLQSGDALVALYNGNNLLSYREGTLQMSAVENVWGRYRRAFWTALLSARYFPQAFQLAGLRAGEKDVFFAPWESNRISGPSLFPKMIRDGDLWLP